MATKLKSDKLLLFADFRGVEAIENPFSTVFFEFAVKQLGFVG